MKIFFWSKECEKAFTNAKSAFKSDNFLTYFNPKLPLIIATDASPMGCGAILSHRMQDGSERLIKFISHTFSQTQRKYSQIDKEAFAIVYAIKQFHKFFYLNKFTLITDHKALTQTIAKERKLPIYSEMRMQHYPIFLSGFNYKIKYRKSEENGNADCLSRLPIKNPDESMDVIDVFYLESITNLPLTAQIILKEIQNDKEILSTVLKAKDA